VFPCAKYALIHKQLLEAGFAASPDFIEPECISDEDLMLVHDPQWIRKLKTGSLSLAEALRLEVPVSSQMLHAMWRMAGGTLRAAEIALQKGVGVNIGGGFHHAFAAHGEGFCAINDIAVAIRKLQRDGAIRKAMVVDCDVHHGNGTASIFADDPTVFTFSIHQKNNYPAVKPPSDLDIDLDDHTCDKEYVAKLQEGLARAFRTFTPNLVVYVAGADPFMEDQLGGLLLTMDGLLERDRLVLSSGHPVAVVLAGGYAHRVRDTVTIHCNTIRAAVEQAATTSHDRHSG
jgi:acetoin utilization deacetylase AcuC-like enzyme